MNRLLRHGRMARWAALFALALVVCAVSRAAAQGEDEGPESTVPRPVPLHANVVTVGTPARPRVVIPSQVKALERPAALARSRDPHAYEVPANLFPWLSATPGGPGFNVARAPRPAVAHALDAFGYRPHTTTAFRANVQHAASPADSRIAVGNAHVVTITNSQVQVWSKSGDSLYIATLDAFFTPPEYFVSCFDPKVVYDEGTGRFYMMCLSYHPSQPQSVFELAISTTGNPLDPWYVYEFQNQLDNNAVDYEELGYGPRGLYISGNYISNSTPALANWPNPTSSHLTTLWVFDKAALLAGGTVGFYRIEDTFGNDSYIFTPKVAQVHGTPPAGLDDFMVGFDGIDSNPSRMKLMVYGLTLPGDFPASGPSIDKRDVETDQPGFIPNPPQLGGPALLSADRLGAPPLMAVYRNGRLYTVTHMPISGPLDIRVFDIDAGGWPNLVLATSDILAGSAAYFYPAVTVNADNAVGAGFSHSSAAEWAGADFSVRQADDGAFSAPDVLKAGEAYFGNLFTDTSSSVYRWGDYSGVAVDPVSQGFWFYNMYPSADIYSSVWRTWVGYVPRAVFVDASYGGVEVGSPSRPWNTFVEGYNDAHDDNDLVMKPAVYGGTYTLSKRVTIVADGGTVQIGP